MLPQSEDFPPHLCTTTIVLLMNEGTFIPDVSTPNKDANPYSSIWLDTVCAVCAALFFHCKCFHLIFRHLPQSRQRLW